jgi:Spy/CpxP family protein refolding chaperone
VAAVVAAASAAAEKGDKPMLKRLIVLGLAACAMAFAQAGGMGGGGAMGDGGSGVGGGSGRGGGGGGMGGEGGGMGGAHVSHLDTWTKDLKLTKDQKKDIKAIMDDGQKQASPLQAQMEKSREAIAETAATAKGDDDIKAAVKKYADLQTQMVSIELNCFVKIYKALDSEQQPKVAGIYTAMNGIFKGKNWNE